MNKKLKMTKSSGNVFKDLGLENPELELMKSQLGLAIFKIFKEKKLNQKQAAELLDVDQPEISKLKNGNYSRFRVERLFYFLNILGRNVDVRVSKARQNPHQRVKIAS